MKTLKKLYNSLTQIETWFVFIVFLFATVATVVNVILRKFNGISFNWIDELSRFIMLITICIGMSVAISHNAHPKMDSVQSLFKGKAKQVVVLLADIILAGLMVLGAYLAIKQEIKTINNGATLSTMPLKLWVFWMFIPLGFTGASVRGILNVVFDIMGFSGKDPRLTEGEGKEAAE